MVIVVATVVVVGTVVVETAATAAKVLACLIAPIGSEGFLNTWDRRLSEFTETTQMNTSFHEFKKTGSNLLIYDKYLRGVLNRKGFGCDDDMLSLL